jgi:hypothetical protein
MKPYKETFLLRINPTFAIYEATHPKVPKTALVELEKQCLIRNLPDDVIEIFH